MSARQSRTRQRRFWFGIRNPNPFRAFASHVANASGSDKPEQKQPSDECGAHSILAAGSDDSSRTTKRLPKPPPDIAGVVLRRHGPTETPWRYPDLRHGLESLLRPVSAVTQ